VQNARLEAESYDQQVEAARLEDIGIWKGQKLIRLKFAVRDIIPSQDPTQKRKELPTPDIHSRGNYGPKGHLEVSTDTTASNFFVCLFYLSV